jgi:hypothetical protein
MRLLRKKFLGVVLASAVGITAGCDDFLDVKNPNNLEAESVDEERDRVLLAQSAYQAFVSSYGEIMVYAAWFTNEARVGDTFPTRNEFGKRDIPPNNGHISGQSWNPLHRAAQFGRETIRATEAAGNTIDLARTYLATGYAFLLVGELHCEGTVAENWLVSRGPMTSQAVVDTAITHLQKAVDIASGLTGNDATQVANAARVGMARGHMFNGRKSQASQLAAQIPDGFVYNLLHLDDPSNRGRLGHFTWSYSEARISLVVGDEFRDIANCGEYRPGATRTTGGGSDLCPIGSASADPRISYVDMGRVAQDGVLRFYRQDKVKGWGDPERLASKLEADYIKVEADGDPAAMLTFINARRAAGNQDALAPTTDMNVLLRELMEQKARDFWLEGKRIGDLRRLGEGVVPYIIPPGNNYYKPELGLVSNQVCWPVPQGEINNNPLWPKT